jgi:hypothetical protein
MKGPFELLFTAEAMNQTSGIMNHAARLGLQKQLKKAFKFLAQDPMHSGL